MNPILKAYFDRIKSLSIDNKIEYAFYKRDSHFEMPQSVHLRFTNLSGSQQNSWGHAQNKDEALGKALMELIERLYFSGFSPFEFKPLSGLFKRTLSLEDISRRFSIPIARLHPSNTNGVAIHLNKKKSLNSSLLELIERHVILYSIVKKISPHFKLIKEVATNKTCSFFIWQGPLKTYVVVGAFTDDKGTYFSSGCDFDKNSAIYKAELELNSFLFLTENVPDDFRIIKDDIQSFNRYHKFSGDKSAINFLSKTSNQKLPELSKKLFYYTMIPQPSIFKGLPLLPATRVIHPDVQQLFFDDWANFYLNPRIFSNNQTLPSFPHIIA